MCDDPRLLYPMPWAMTTFFRVDEMSTQKPTEAIPVKKTIADATKFSQGLSSVELTEAILTALSAAGYVIVPREPTEAMAKAGGLVDIRDRGSFYGDGTTLLPDEDASLVYIAMIAAEKGE